MLSTKRLKPESFPIAVLVTTKGKLKETIFYTEPKRGDKRPEKSFKEELAEYLTPGPPEVKGSLQLADDFRFEMVPTISDAPNQPRFINYYISASNSGKSYQIAALCRRYLQMFPENLIAYASANEIENDSNYDDIRDRIRVVDVVGLESIIDFSDPQFASSLWIFDDCDGGFSVDLQDLDKRLTPEELAKLTVTEKQKASKLLKARCEDASLWLQRSIASFMTNGRKFAQSLCIVGHKPFSGAYENLIVNEATGIVLFPASIQKNLLEKFFISKLSLDKEQAREILYDQDWYQYDYLYVSHKTSKVFTLTNFSIKLYS